jgi:hypothetical protein
MARSFLESNSLAIARLERIEQDLRAWAAKSVKISFNPKGTPLFSMMELYYSYPRRCVDFGDAVRSLIAASRIVPATVVGRALIETVAMGCLYLHDMERLIAAKDHDRLELKFARFYAGIKGQRVEPIHVMDAIRHLERIDAAYVAYLDKKYGVFTRFMESVKAAGKYVEGKSFGEMLSVKENYELLCEVSHPNGIGMQFLYPDESNETEDVENLRARFRFASLMSIWQCHHLLVARLSS